MKYGDKIQMMYTDTDSFILNIETENFYHDMTEDIHRYDTDDYGAGNIFGVPPANRKIPGLFKDETKGVPVYKFIGLKSKMYCIITIIGEKKKAKGVKSSVVKFEDYV